MRANRAACLRRLATFVVGWLLLPGLAGAEVVYGTEGNRLRRYDVDTIGSERLVEEVFVERASGSDETPEGGLGALEGRDVNGQICFFPDASGRFVIGEDTGQPSPPAGWGIFSPKGEQIGKLTATYPIPNPEPFGCAFNSEGILFTSSVGAQGFDGESGQLLMWFPPYTGFPGPAGAYPETDDPSSNFCKLATDISTAASIAIDADDNVYIASAGAGSIFKFAPPFPTGPDAAGGCGSGSGIDAPMADTIDRSLFVAPPAKLFTPSGLATSNHDTLYVASVLTGRIGEYDLGGNLLRFIVDHGTQVGTLPTPFGNPQGISLGSDGTLYYADLQLIGNILLNNVRPGPNGKVWRVRFDSPSEPRPPELVRDGLSFPDGVTAAPGDLEQTEWSTYGRGPDRRSFDPDEAILTPDNAADLALRWTFPTGGVITASPIVAAVDLPGEGLTQVAYFQSWDRTLYAVRVIDGSAVWTLPLERQPGSSFENAASAHIAKVDNRDVVFLPAGEILYAVDAATGSVLWRFTAGTGCMDEFGDPPGLCAFTGERNQIESSPYLAGGKVFFGMDVNDRDTGKGGFYAVAATTGTLAWFFDPQSGATCTPDPGDEIYFFDGYHTAAELGLSPDFFDTRAGCDFPRDANGCGNIWSSPAVDLQSEQIFTASSNCDTPIDPGSGLPLPMPPFDEAIFALDFDGQPLWRWRPREFDNEDLAFGGVPNLFTIEVEIAGVATDVEVVGVGNKDGTYYVLDRSGTNQVTGVSWDDDPATHLPADLPYWATQAVAGGDIGGIIATAAVDEARRRVYFSTAPGQSGVNDPPDPPQTPVVHALDLDTGQIAWQSDGGGLPLASFGPTTAIAGLTFIGQTPAAFVRSYLTEGDDGSRITNFNLNNFSGLASPAVPIDGTLLVGEGVGTRTRSGTSPGDVAADTPSQLHALCVSGTGGCAACDDGIDNDSDGAIDATEDDGCVTPADPSEVLGDLDYDGDVDEIDRQRFFQAFGHRVGQVGYVDAANFDRDPFSFVSLVDYQIWLQALDDYNTPLPICGLVGVEPLALLAGVHAFRRLRRRRNTGERSEG